MEKLAQEKFASFILERVQEGKEEQARVLLEENFKKQDEGSFSQMDIQSFLPRMMNLLQRDKIDDIKAIVTKFSSNFNK